MKLLALLAISCSAFAAENNAYIFFDRNEDLHETIMMEYQGHWYELYRIEHSFICPCQD